MALDLLGFLAEKGVQVETSDGDQATGNNDGGLLAARSSAWSSQGRGPRPPRRPWRRGAARAGRSSSRWWRPPPAPPPSCIPLSGLLGDHGEGEPRGLADVAAAGGDLLPRPSVLRTSLPNLASSTTKASSSPTSRITCCIEAAAAWEATRGHPCRLSPPDTSADPLGRD